MRGHLPKMYGIILGLPILQSLRFVLLHFPQYNFDVGLAALRCWLERFEHGLNKLKKVTLFSVVNTATRNSTCCSEKNFVQIANEVPASSLCRLPSFREFSEN